MIRCAGCGNNGWGYDESGKLQYEAHWDKYRRIDEESLSS